MCGFFQIMYRNFLHLILFNLVFSQIIFHLSLFNLVFTQIVDHFNFYVIWYNFYKIRPSKCLIYHIYQIFH